MRGRDAGESAPHILRTNDIDAADGVPERGAAAPHRHHHGANDMDPQTIERAIKRCIEISVRLGALEDDVPSAAGSVIVQCVDDIDEMQRWLEGRE